MSRKVRVLFEQIHLWHKPFTLDLEVEDGEEVDDAIERHWMSGLIPGHAEAAAIATDIILERVIQDPTAGQADTREPSCHA